MTAVAAPFVVATSNRPSSGCMRSVSKNVSDTCTTRAKAPVSRASMRTFSMRLSSIAATVEKIVVSASDWKSAWDVGPYAVPLYSLVYSVTSVDGSPTPAGARMSNASSTPYTAALTPVPSARLTSSTVATPLA